MAGKQEDDEHRPLSILPSSERRKKRTTYKANINGDLFEELCKLGFPTTSICDALLVSSKTLQTWTKRTYGKTYEEVKSWFQANGVKRMVMQNLIQLSSRKSAAAIFLAKNYLGLQDSPAPADSGDRTQNLASAIAKAFLLVIGYRL